MFKIIILFAFYIWLSPGLALNEHYYLMNPKVLQKELGKCKINKHFNKEKNNCEKLNAIGILLNKLAFELQMSPQGFGNKILNLQELISKQESGSPALAESQQELRQRLAIVKWLESPTS